jgi:hypothetical protein
LGWQLTATMVDAFGPWPLRPLGQVGDGEGRSGSKGGEGPARGQSMSPLSGATPTGHVSGSDGRFERDLAPRAVPEDCGRRVAPMHPATSRAPGRALDRQLTDTRVEVSTPEQKCIGWPD